MRDKTLSAVHIIVIG